MRATSKLLDCLRKKKSGGLRAVAIAGRSHVT
jgi:hypothetical protein